jgi:dTDP-4-dehydrorhamnose reductase
MPRPILLIGAGGQVGRELQTTLAKLGNVISTVRSTCGDAAPAHAIALDLTDVAELRQVVRQIQPGLIVNAAAYTAVAQAEDDRETAEATNAIAPGVLAEEALRANAALVHYSTDYVFDGSGDRRWNEDHATTPLNVYGRTKLAGETAIRNSGVAHLVVRVAWIYSAHGKNFVKTILRLARAQDELRVINDQVGAPTSARRIAIVTAQILKQAGDDPVAFFRQRGGIVHVCAAGETTWHAMAVEILRLARAAGLPLRVRQVVPITTAEYGAVSPRPLNSRLDCSRLRDRFGLELSDWKDDLAQEFSEIAASVLREA